MGSRCSPSTLIILSCSSKNTEHMPPCKHDSFHIHKNLITTSLQYKNENNDCHMFCKLTLHGKHLWKLIICTQKILHVLNTERNVLNF